MWDAHRLVINNHLRGGKRTKRDGVWGARRIALPRRKDEKKRDGVWGARRLALSRGGKRVETRRRVECTPPRISEGKKRRNETVCGVHAASHFRGGGKRGETTRRVERTPPRHHGCRLAPMLLTSHDSRCASA